MRQTFSLSYKLYPPAPDASLIMDLEILRDQGGPIWYQGVLSVTLLPASLYTANGGNKLTMDGH